ncbi:hypothetical protein FDP41_010683 [Naegleria fowleri]|uniref:Uncharacterized protein n=1 Tax=Naegleria fowleri TaxID=5763 RepID=A0A6A5CDN2_NAEFO|nr:uncharacterized protein FDP41_010683 [Naegleria fowleri]KAF0983618.1 hypothetical protein FDP41_010683 [Naegleria fowleri]CAG4715537.1 unnamed protein product [Naegleria fowleri]
MPQHNPPHYFKDNSLEGFLENFGDYVDKHNRIVYNMWDYDYYYDDDQYSMMNTIPIALILELQEDHHENLPKYILWGDLTRQIPKRNYRPSYLFVAIRSEGCWIEVSFALLKLGRLGSCVDDSRLTFLHHLNNDNSSMKSYSMSDQLLSFYISQNDEKQITFLCEIEFQFQLVLNDQDVKKSTFHYLETFNYLSTRYKSFWGESSLFSVNENVYYHAVMNSHWNGGLGSFQTTDLIRVSTQSDNNQYANVEQVICIKNGPVVYALLMEKQENDNNEESYKEFFVILTEERKRESSIQKIHIQKNEPPSKTNVYFTNFEKYFVDEQNKFNLEIVAHCKLTFNKYLVMAYCKSKRNHITKVNTFQQLFTDRTMWLLIDVQSKHIKQVFPRVYDLAKKQHDTKDDFTPVTKRKRRGTFSVLSNPEYEDGDLNGGYSNVTLLKQIKNLKGVNDKDYENEEQSNEDTIPFDQELMSPNIETMKGVFLKAFRPFATNADIFQVMVFFTTTQPKQYAKMFRFFFKFRDECNINLHKVAKYFTDVTFEFK